MSHKMVNGVSTPLTEEELADFQAREVAHLAEQQRLAGLLYQEQRRRAYPSLDEMLVALIEKEEGRPEALNALMLKRVQVKNTYPKS
jgi:uncharacterized protein YbaR (Trm112 family)